VQRVQQLHFRRGELGARRLSARCFRLLRPRRLDVGLGRVGVGGGRRRGGGGGVGASLQHGGAAVQDVRERGAHDAPSTHALDRFTQARRQSVQDVLNDHPLERLHAHQRRLLPNTLYWSVSSNRSSLWVCLFVRTITFDLKDLRLGYVHGMLVHIGTVYIKFKCQRHRSKHKYSHGMTLLRLQMSEGLFCKMQELI